jgi:geranyl-CoA carboxylase beta subunit
MPAHHREPVDMHEVMARLVDGSELLLFKSGYGAATLCAQAHIGGHAVGLISNNGPIDVAGASKAAHFINGCASSVIPSSICRTPRATWWARTASRPA